MLGLESWEQELPVRGLRRGAYIIGAALAMAVLAHAFWEVSVDDDSSPSIATTGREALGTVRQSPASAKDALSEQAPHAGRLQHAASVAAVKAAEERGENERSLRWDSTAASERSRVMRTQLHASTTALQDDNGRNDREALRRGEEALTALRPELYATAGGKLEHQRLEAEFDELCTHVEATLPPEEKTEEAKSR